MTTQENLATRWRSSAGTTEVSGNKVLHFFGTVKDHAPATHGMVLHSHQVVGTVEHFDFIFGTTHVAGELRFKARATNDKK